MTKMSYDEAESVRLGELVATLHHELTGEPLQFLDMPHPDAIAEAMRALREGERAVADLVNDR